MISLYKLLRSLFPDNNVVVVKRLPAVKALRFHLLGLTVGFVLVLLNLVFSSAEFSLLTNVVVGLWFALAAYFGIIFIILTGLVLALVPVFLPAFPFLIALQANFVWFVIGYIFGAVLAILYNDFVYLFVNIFERDQIRVAFAVDTNRAINIIKSPREEEELALLGVIKPLIFYVQEIRADRNRTGNAASIRDFVREAHRRMTDFDQARLLELLPGAGGFEDRLEALRNQLAAGDEPILERTARQIEPIIEKYLKLKELKLYDYQVDLPPAPYTIAFVANPTIRKRQRNARDPAFEPDPIITDLDLFLQTVHRGLASLEVDSVVGRPEIWSRIRVVTIRNENARGEDFSLVEEFQEEAYSSSGDPIDNNILDPRREMRDHLNNILQQVPAADRVINIDEIDIIYGVSASKTHDRSFAHASDWEDVEPEEVPPDNIPDRAGVEFDFVHDPSDNKHDSYGRPTIERPEFIDDDPPSDESPFFRRVHDFYALQPGRVALSAIGSRLKTFIHEFGHAMCSTYHGGCVDEYTDGFIIEGLPDLPPWFYANRIERNGNLGTYIRAHKEFAQYECTAFHSDLDHPSAEEDWIGYFPDRVAPGIPCTMDRTYGIHQFDQLLGNFLYDRLMAKVLRPVRPEITFSDIWGRVDATTDLIATLTIRFMSLPPLNVAVPDPPALLNILESHIQPILIRRFETDRVRVEGISITEGTLTAAMSLRTEGAKVADLFGPDGFSNKLIAFEKHLRAVDLYLERKLEEALGPPRPAEVLEVS